MSNHFHILVYLPPRVEVSDDEVMRRISLLKGDAGRRVAEMQLAQWRAQGDEKRVNEWFDRQRARMFDIGEFMKIVKQWFTEDYNNRQSHIGTLWESVYRDRAVPMKVRDLSQVAGYIHLNPIRAAVCARFSEYRWSSFTALANGDRMALEGMRFIYDEPDASAEDLIARHSALMNNLLEGIKLQRAEDIARRRAAGYEIAADPLTSEALIAQAAQHLKEVQNATIANNVVSWSAKRESAEKKILAAISRDPLISAQTMMSEIGMTKSKLYRHLSDLQKRGVLTRLSTSSPWIVNLGN